MSLDLVRLLDVSENSWHLCFRGSVAKGLVIPALFLAQVQRSGVVLVGIPEPWRRGSRFHTVYLNYHSVRQRVQLTCTVCTVLVLLVSGIRNEGLPLETCATWRVDWSMSALRVASKISSSRLMLVLQYCNSSSGMIHHFSLSVRLIQQGGAYLLYSSHAPVCTILSAIVSTVSEPHHNKHHASVQLRGVLEVPQERIDPVQYVIIFYLR